MSLNNEPRKTRRKTVKTLLLSSLLVLTVFGGTAVAQGGLDSGGDANSGLWARFTSGTTTMVNSGLSRLGLYSGGDGLGLDEVHSLAHAHALELEYQERLSETLELDLSGRDQVHLDGVGDVPVQLVSGVVYEVQGTVSGSYGAAQEAILGYNSELGGAYSSYQALRGDAYAEIRQHTASELETAGSAAMEAIASLDVDVDGTPVPMSAGGQAEAHAKIVLNLASKLSGESDQHAHSTFEASDQLSGGLYDRGYGEAGGTVFLADAAAVEAHGNAEGTIQAFELFYATLMDQLEFDVAAQQALRDETEAQVGHIIELQAAMDQVIAQQAEARAQGQYRATMAAAAGLEHQASVQHDIVMGKGFGASHYAEAEAREQAGHVLAAGERTSATLRAQAGLILGLEAQSSTIVGGVADSAFGTAMGVVGNTPVGGLVAGAAGGGYGTAQAAVVSELRTELRQKAEILLEASVFVEADAQARAGLIMEAYMHTGATIEAYAGMQADLVFDAYMGAAADVRAQAQGGYDGAIQVGAEMRAAARSSTHTAAAVAVQGAYEMAIGTQMQVSGRDGITMDLDRRMYSVLAVDADVIQYAGGEYAAVGTAEADQKAYYWYGIEEDVRAYADHSVVAVATLQAQHDIVADVVADHVLFYEYWLDVLTDTDYGADGGSF